MLYKITYWIESIQESDCYVVKAPYISTAESMASSAANFDYPEDDPEWLETNTDGDLVVDLLKPHFRVPNVWS